MNNKSTGRNYAYDKAYEQKHVQDRIDRNRARRIVFRKLAAKVGKSRARQMMKGKDVDHIKPIVHGGTTTPSNLRLLTPHKNRGMKYN